MCLTLYVLKITYKCLTLYQMLGVSSFTNYSPKKILKNIRSNLRNVHHDIIYYDIDIILSYYPVQMQSVVLFQAI